MSRVSKELAPYGVKLIGAAYSGNGVEAAAKSGLTSAAALIKMYYLRWAIYQKISFHRIFCQRFRQVIVRLGGLWDWE